MDLIFNWSLKASLLLTLLFGVYYFLFNSNSNHQLKRGILLLILGMAVSFPLIQLSTSSTLITQATSEQPGFLPNTQLSKLPITYQPIEATYSENAKYTTQQILLLVYSAGIIISFLLLLVEALRLYRWSKTGTKILIYKTEVTLHAKVKSPFSFWGKIFLPSTQMYDKETLQAIVVHEMAHVKQRHSFDSSLTAIAQCVLWYNPVIYLLHRQIKLNHELIADSKTIAQVGQASYAKSLLKICMDGYTSPLAHAFSQKTSLTKRLKAMKNTPSKKYKTAIALGSICIFSLLLFSQTSLQQVEENLHLPTKFISINSNLGGDGRFNTEKVTDYAGEQPDTWVSNPFNNILIPITLPEKYKRMILESQKATSAFNGAYSRLVLNEEPKILEEKFFHLKNEDYYKTDLMIRLSKKERLEILDKANDYIEKYVQPIYPNYQTINELEFLKLEYLMLISPGGESIPPVRKLYTIEELDVQPSPNGGLKRFIESVGTNLGDVNLTAIESLPNEIIFEATIVSSGIFTSLKLVSEIEDDSPQADQAYAILGQLNKNIIEFSKAYGWRPGEADGKKVATAMPIVIPKNILK